MTGILSIQVTPKIGSKENNIKKIELFIKKFAHKNLDLVVIPEFFSTGIDYDMFLNSPEDENGGETIAKISELAKKYNTNIIAGTVIENSGEKLYNTCFVLNRKGETITKYRKIHLFNYMGGTEGDRITAGNEIVTVECDFGKIGLGICYDIRYPLHFKELAKQNVDMIVLPTAWCIPNEIYEDEQSLKYAQDMWLAINRTRAYDNMVFLVSSNQTKQSNNNVSCIGNSVIISPTAEVIANAKNDQGGIYAEVDLTAVKYLRSLYPIANID